MALIVETGAGFANAESYASAQAFEDHCAAFGLDYGNPDDVQIEQALRRATRWLDSTYRARFPGARRFGRAQALEWPRTGAYVRLADVGVCGWGGGTIDTPLAYDAIPAEIVRATIEAAVREAATPGALMPDPSPGGGIKMERAGDTAREYFPSANRQPVFATIEAILTGLLGTKSGLTARAARA